MFSWEIENYIKSNNYILNVDQLQLLTDRRLHPQITNVRQNQDQTWEIETCDNYCFKFSVISMKQYYEHIKQLIHNFKEMYDGTYRVYASLEAEPWQLVTVTKKLDRVFEILDELILCDSLEHSSYIVISRADNCDTPVYAGHGNKLDYLRWRDYTHVENLALKKKL